MVRTKYCARCKKNRLLKFFWLNKTGYYNAYCKTCSVEIGREWKKKNRARWLHLKNKHTARSRYGLSLDEIQALYKKQTGHCAICKQKKELVVDHNHRTKKVRELLCRACNLMIGYAQEDPIILKKGIQYLKKHG